MSDCFEVCKHPRKRGYALRLRSGKRLTYMLADTMCWFKFRKDADRRCDVLNEAAAKDWLAGKDPFPYATPESDREGERIRNLNALGG